MAEHDLHDRFPAAFSSPGIPDAPCPAREAAPGRYTAQARIEAERLLRQYRTLVRRVAQQMIVKLPSNVEIDDLIQVGMIGLGDALSRFDAAQGVLFETFATQRIRGAMLDELRSADWMSRGMRRKQRMVEAAVHRLEHGLGRTPRAVEIAAEMGLDLPDYQALLAQVHGTQLVSLEDLCAAGDEDYLDRHVADLGAHPLAALDDETLRGALEAAFDTLPEREQYVMQLYYEHEMSMKEIAAVLGVTESRICQLHGQSIARLRAKLREW